MKIIATVKLLQASLIASALLLSTASFAGEKLNKAEMNALLVGNFMKIVYIYEGESIAMWEYYQKDGTIAGSTDKWGDYSATYEINDDGEMCVTYASEAYNGCYGYERIADNTYKLVGLTWPENTTLDVDIIPGSTMNISAN